MGWTVSPAMAELAPSILQRLYRESSLNDVFVAGPSGVAYTFPDVISNASDFAESTIRFMQRADLAIVNVIAAADCDADCALPYVRAGADAVFLYTYGYGQQITAHLLPRAFVMPCSCFSRDFYCGRGAKLTWVLGAPVVGGRMALW
jgi:hypothetical protein